MKFSDTWVKATYQSPLGPMLLAAGPKGLSGVWFEGQKHQPVAATWAWQPEHPVLMQTAKALRDYFSGQTLSFQVPLEIEGGTAFQQQVWQALMAIAPGQTTSYGALARAIARPDAVRAVAAAVGRNSISILIPCHRVLGGDGSLVGYAGGLHRKAALLQLEGANSGVLV